MCNPCNQTGRYQMISYLSMWFQISKKWPPVFDIPQVVNVVEEYQSFPTNSLYTTENVISVDPPAFTICPKPSSKASIPKRDWNMYNHVFKSFEDTSVYMLEFVNIKPISTKPLDFSDESVAFSDGRYSLLPLKILPAKEWHFNQFSFS